MKQLCRAAFGCAVGLALALGVSACTPSQDPDGPVVSPVDPSPTVSEPSPDPSSDSPASEPTSDEPSPSETDAPPLPKTGLPLPAEEDWDPEDVAWEGHPPPVLFQPVFRSGEWPGFPESFDGHELENEMDFGSSFRGEYKDADGKFSYAFEVSALPTAYGGQIDLWEQPQQVAFAVCDAAEQEHPDCMTVANDAVFNLTWTGAPGAMTMEETAQRLGEMMVELSER